MKRKSYLVLSCLVLPLVAIVIAHQAHAQSQAHKRPIGALTGAGSLSIAAVMHPGSGGGFVVIDTNAKDSKGNLTTAYFGYSDNGARISPSAGRRAIGHARAIMDICHVSSTWDECSTDCATSCDSSTNPSCGSGGPNNSDCVDQCGIVQADNSLCNGGNDGL